MNCPVPTAPIVCIIDDDEAVRDSLHVLLMTRGIKARAFESATSFLADARKKEYDCLLIDMHMPEMTGLALLLALRQSGDTTPVIVVTGGADKAITEQLTRAGALGVLRKPVSEVELFTWLERALGDANGIAS